MKEYKCKAALNITDHHVMQLNLSGFMTGLALLSSSLVCMSPVHVFGEGRESMIGSAQRFSDDTEDGLAPLKNNYPAIPDTEIGVRIKNDDISAVNAAQQILKENGLSLTREEMVRIVGKNGTKDNRQEAYNIIKRKLNATERTTLTTIRETLPEQIIGEGLVQDAVKLNHQVMNTQPLWKQYLDKGNKILFEKQQEALDEHEERLLISANNSAKQLQKNLESILFNRSKVPRKLSADALAALEARIKAEENTGQIAAHEEKLQNMTQQLESMQRAFQSTQQNHQQEIEKLNEALSGLRDKIQQFSTQLTSNTENDTQLKKTLMHFLETELSRSQEAITTLKKWPQEPSSSDKNLEREETGDYIPLS